MPDLRSLLLLGLTVTLTATEPPPTKKAGHRPSNTANTFHLDVPAQAYDLLLVRPEDHSITLSVLAYTEAEGYVTWGATPAADAQKSSVHRLPAGTPEAFVLSPLAANTRHYYRFHWRASGARDYTASEVHLFHTARTPGTGFNFTLTADAHLDEHTSNEVYQQTLANIRTSGPDFHLDLGNLFMTDKHAARTEAARQYLAQRYYLGQIGSSIPVLLALGTHEGETAKYNDGSADNLALWANQQRTQLFPNPEPDAFYSGNTHPLPGRSQNYYSFTWGDALFVVLDAFGYTQPQHPKGDGWAWSLGEEQYRWLERTLAGSHARWKFVFIHNLLCGDQAARGGVEVARNNEWGGRNRDGSDGFSQHRPDWPLPVHPLLVRHGVHAVFKAHDNFYARQELDGIVYLMVPQPSFAGNDRIRDLENYGYKTGVFLGNSGHVRVTVAPEKVTLDYVKSSPAETVADHCELVRPTPPSN